MDPWVLNAGELALTGKKDCAYLRRDCYLDW
jgi:hypothetical protein